MMKALDIFFTLFHLAIIVFNLFGWIPKKTRLGNFIVQMLTAASWFILGIWYGTGYCPITDWQWQVKENLGEKNLPQNFVEYIAEKITGNDYEPSFISNVIAISFVAAILCSLYVNFILPQIKKRNRRQPGK